MVHARLDTERGRIILDPAWNEGPLLKQVPGISYIAKTKLWSLPLTWASMVILRGVFMNNFTYDEDLTEWVWRERRIRLDPSIEMREQTKGVDIGDLYPFQ